LLTQVSQNTSQEAQNGGQRCSTHRRQEGPGVCIWGLASPGSAAHRAGLRVCTPVPSPHWSSPPGSQTSLGKQEERAVIINPVSRMDDTGEAPHWCLGLTAIWRGTPSSRPSLPAQASSPQPQASSSHTQVQEPPALGLTHFCLLYPSTNLPKSKGVHCASRERVTSCFADCCATQG
jgi:hypothetical protein